MSKFAWAIAGVFLGISCTTLPDAVNRLRKFQDRRYRPAQDFEANNPIGKLAFRYCAKEKFWGKECKYYKSEIKDFCDPETFEKFRNAGFIMIQEKRVD